MRLYANDCSNFIKKWLQPNSFGEMCYLDSEETFNRCDKFKFDNFESALYMKSVSMPIIDSLTLLQFTIHKIQEGSKTLIIQCQPWINIAIRTTLKISKLFDLCSCLYCTQSQNSQESKTAFIYLSNYILTVVEHARGFKVYLYLRGCCTSYPKIACILLYLKIINTLLKDNIFEFLGQLTITWSYPKRCW